MQTGPRYQMIQTAMEERLKDGTYPVGSLMPTESALASEFDVSRFTVREALRHLVEAGYITRRQGQGTKVISAQPGGDFVQSFSSLDALIDIAKETWFVMHDVTQVVLDADLAERVGGSEGETWFCVRGVRWTRPGGQAICVIESYIPTRFAAAVERLEDYDGPFFGLIETYNEGDIDAVNQEIRAVQMPRHVSQSLGLPRDAWALQMLRRYSSGGDVLIASFNWHPADQMTYTMQIERGRRG